MDSTILKIRASVALLGLLVGGVPNAIGSPFSQCVTSKLESGIQSESSADLKIEPVNTIQSISIDGHEFKDGTKYNVKVNGKDYSLSVIAEKDGFWISATDSKTGKLHAKVSLNKASDIVNLVGSLDPAKGFKPGKKYRIHAGQDSSIKTLTYVNWEEKAKGPVLKFTDETGKTIEVEQSKLHESVPFKPDAPLSAKINALITQPAVASLLGRVLFYPLPRVAGRGSLEVVGAPWVSKSLAQTLLNNISQMDQVLTKLGFTIPDSTRFVLRDKPLLPNLVGPAYIKGPVFNILNPRAKSTIVMQPVLWSKKTLTEPSISFHERAHSVLYRTYSGKAFVNQNKTVQEALADFTAAHITGSPVIGQGAMLGKDLRNVETRTNGLEKKSVDSLLSIRAGINAHDDSMLFSNILWRLRQKLGPEKMSSALKPMIDDLNRHHDSFLELSKAKQATGKVDARQKTIDEFEYFLASLLKSSETLGIHNEVAPEIQKAVAELHLDETKIDALSKGLARSKDTYAYDGQGRLLQGVILTGYGVAGIALDAYGYYEMKNWVVGKKDDKKDKK